MMLQCNYVQNILLINNRKWITIREMSATDLISLNQGLDPDPVSNFTGSGSGFSPRIPGAKKCRKGSKSYLLEENLKIMTKDRQKWKRQQFLIQYHHKIVGKFSRPRCLDPDPVLKKSWIRIRLYLEVGSVSGLSWEAGSDSEISDRIRNPAPN